MFRDTVNYSVLFWRDKHVRVIVNFTCNGFFFFFFGGSGGGVCVHIGSGKHFLYSALLYRNLHPNLIGNLVHN